MPFGVGHGLVPGKPPEGLTIRARPTSAVPLDDMSQKVVLFLPPYTGGLIGPPLSLLSLASPLRAAGFEPRIIDGALQPDYLDRIEREIQDCLCFGVSLLTGPMIATAIAVAQHVKKLRPDLPVIFGGWHPSLLPAQTLR